MRLFIQIIDIYAHTHTRARAYDWPLPGGNPRKKKGEKKVSGAAEKGNDTVVAAQCRR